MAWMRGSSQSLGEAGKFLQVTRAPHAPSPAVTLEAKALGQRFLSLGGSSDPSSWSDSSISIRLTSEEVKDFNCSSGIPFPQLAQHLVTFASRGEGLQTQTVHVVRDRHRVGASNPCWPLATDRDFCVSWKPPERRVLCGGVGP